MSSLLKKGSRGEDVKRLQMQLNLLPDGIFGPLTEEAVKDFQRACGLAVDGVVGPSTQKALQGRTELPRRIDEIIIHCSATPEGMDFTVEQIRACHLQRGFSDIGYHYVIYRDSSVHQGRALDKSGAHCSGHNSHSIGVCYVGGCPPKSVAGWQQKAKDTRTDAQKQALRALVAKLKEQFPGATVHGHYEFANKSCPSFNICDL